jgi:hypothetical protein
MPPSYDVRLGVEDVSAHSIVTFRDWGIGVVEGAEGYEAPCSIRERPFEAGQGVLFMGGLWKEKRGTYKIRWSVEDSKRMTGL